MWFPGQDRPRDSTESRLVSKRVDARPGPPKAQWSNRYSARLKRSDSAWMEGRLQIQESRGWRIKTSLPRWSAACSSRERRSTVSSSFSATVQPGPEARLRISPRRPPRIFGVAFRSKEVKHPSTKKANDLLARTAATALSQLSGVSSKERQSAVHPHRLKPEIKPPWKGEPITVHPSNFL
jgi:hypothetical protein